MNKANLAKNTLFFTTALALQKLLSFIYFIFIARALFVDDLGKFTFALSLGATFAILMDLGTSQVLIRQSARRREDAQSYLANILGFKIVTALAVYALMALTVNLLGYPELTKQLVYLTGLVMIVDSFTTGFYSVMRGLQNLFYESFGVVANQLIILSLGLVVLRLDLGLAALIMVYLLGSIFNFGYSLFWLNRRYGIRLRLEFKREIIYRIIKIALPFAVAGIFIRIYSYLDIILLSKLADDVAVGIYSVAYKAAFALQFIGVAFAAAVYPAFCRYFVSSPKLLADSFVKSMYYLMAIALPLSVGVITIADKVIGPVFGEQYQPAVWPLQILMVSLVLVFLAFPVGTMLNASNRQTRNTVHLGIVAGFNLIANLILIPLYGYAGAALAALLSYVLLFGLGIVVVEKIVEYNKRYLLITLAKILFSCLIMGLAVLYLKPFLHFLAIIPLAAAVYIIALYLVGGWHQNDLKQLRDLVLKKSEI